MEDAIFVERRFDLDGRDLVARFFMPMRAPGGEFQCRWSIDWPEGAVGRRACGEDGVQALMLAMRSVHEELRASEPYKAGKLTLWEQKDLDLPPTWGAGPLYSLGADGAPPILA